MPPIKPRPNPNEPFKQALTGTLRAIAGKPDLEVGFGNDEARLDGEKAVLPELPRSMSKADVEIGRAHV